MEYYSFNVVVGVAFVSEEVGVTVVSHSLLPKFEGLEVSSFVIYVTGLP